jgi:hypothetical protein
MEDLELPTCEQLMAGIQAFEKNEKRGYMYYDALDRISDYWGTSTEMAYGVKMLLDGWPLAFYRCGYFNFSLLVECIQRNLELLDHFKQRSIRSLSNTDHNQINNLFNDLLDALRGGKRASPVAVAKSLHLLAPDFFPPWDTEIALGYGSWWAFSEFGALEYVPFCWKMKCIAASVADYECIRNPNPKRTPLKLIDEYNYSKFTKKWI